MVETVSPNYFRLMNIGLRDGRQLKDSDADTTLPVADISRNLAARYFPGENPIGKKIKIGAADSDSQWLTIVGIVDDVHYSWINKHAADGRLVPYEEEKHAEIISFDQSTKEIVTEKRKEYLQNALLRLPVEYREVILLYEFEGLSYKELAVALGIPVGTVMSRLSRARRRLQQEFTHIRGAEAVNEL